MNKTLNECSRRLVESRKCGHAFLRSVEKQSYRSSKE